MVPTGKMVQPGYRLIQLILLCFIWQLGTVSLGWSQHSSIRIQQEDKGEILLFLINVLVHIVGKKLDKGYKCPVYCGVDHIHRWRCNDAKKAYLQGDYDVFRPDGVKDSKQSKSDLRSTGGVWIDCSDSDSLVGIL